MSGHLDAVCGAEFGARFPGADQPTGTDTVTGNPGRARSSWPIPKLREGSYFPDWLLKRRNRARPPKPSTAPAKVGRPPPARRVAGVPNTAGWG